MHKYLFLHMLLYFVKYVNIFYVCYGCLFQ